MDQSALSTASRWLLLARLGLATLGQYAGILVIGALLSVALGIGFDYPVVPQAAVAEPIREFLGEMLFQAYIVFYFSWPTFFILLLTLGLLRGYGYHWPAGQRWALLLAGITAGVWLPVLYWSEIIDLSFSSAAATCRAWILVAYVAILWANRKYLRSSLPPA
ncbi:hypothetical protein [Hymenobacter lucidus]|uniref:DUF2569 family protein n=1 Tax=Hymenobacter lucidus TaxID=2880930 RepID=A0ABS8ARQ8_9BACT|nr:hypothetical protein [Hymenobacter lucidus]MCB2407391.1 hypothetical protein [Hymenobacter lucidus]